MNYENFEENEYITIVDESGEDQQYHIDAIFEMDHHKYIMYSSNHDTLLSRIEYLDGFQYFSEVTEEEIQDIIDAYQQSIHNHKHDYEY